MWGCVKVSDSGFPTRYSFDNILNQIPCVNSFKPFLPTINFEISVGRNSGEIFTQVIRFRIFLKEYRAGNSESDTLTTPPLINE